MNNPSPNAVQVEPWIRFVVITVQGHLVEHVTDNRITVDDWGEPYQDQLWASVRREVDPHRGQVGGIALDHGMRAKIVEDSALFPALYPDNPVACAVLSWLGAQPRPWRGCVAIVGTEDSQGITTSLTQWQRELLGHTHDHALRLTT